VDKYDTLEYSWVKAITISVRLQNFLCVNKYQHAHNIKLYQIYVESAFLNDYINEEVYVEQPPGFEDYKKPNHVYKFKKGIVWLEAST
jgi:hypothetical protein